MNLIRTFHPVGQGAFYTERFTLSDHKFTIVYDCGSSTFSTKDMEKKINSVFNEEDKIDILFISHFHSDHINGLEMLHKRCKIKIVIIPEIDEESKTLYLISNLMKSNNSHSKIIQNPEKFFGKDVKIIRIPPVNLDNSEFINLESKSINFQTLIEFNNLYNSDLKNKRSLESGTKITNKHIEWEFIPFNYLQKDRSIQFKKELKHLRLKLKDIDSIKKIKLNKGLIRKAYLKIDGDLNKNSMILYSGSITKNTSDAFVFQDFNTNSHLTITELKNGCLYFGDINLNENKCVEDIKSRLINQMNFVGILQVPHHGSIHNFSSNILSDSVHYCIFSFGSKNSYGHPSCQIIKTILAAKKNPILITEHSSGITFNLN